MRKDYENYMIARGLASNTVAAQLHRCSFVEKYEGDLDKHFEKDRIQSLYQKLIYTANDERQNKPNTTALPLGPNANIRKNLASYRSAVGSYRKFLELEETGEFDVADIQPEDEEIDDENLNTFSLERDLQTALRDNISQLEPGLEIADGGTEMSVETGRIDIVANDRDGVPVIIELKAGTASPKAVAQILGYMGSYMGQTGQDVRGILVAGDFQAKTELAAKPVPNLLLRRYQYKFEFE